MYYDVCILSCLMEKPMHGYEIGKKLKGTFTVCTRISNNTIYPILSRFLKQGWITKQREAQERKPDRIVYEITEAGKKGFIQTLNTVTNTLACDREEFFVRISFFRLLTPDIRRRILADRLAVAREILQTAEALEEPEGAYSRRAEEAREFVLNLYRLEIDMIEKLQGRIDEPCLAPQEYLL